MHFITQTPVGSLQLKLLLFAIGFVVVVIIFSFSCVAEDDFLMKQSAGQGGIASSADHVDALLHPSRRPKWFAKGAHKICSSSDVLPFYVEIHAHMQFASITQSIITNDNNGCYVRGCSMQALRW